MKKVIFASIVLASQLATAGTLYDFRKTVGCATVVAVRDTTQAPLYNDDYQNRYNGSYNTTGEFGLLAQLTNTGIVGAVVGSVVADAALQSQLKPVPVIEPKRGWRDLKAVTLKFDDGRVVNLPMADADRWVRGHAYDKEIGKRFPFSYNEELKTLLIGYRAIPVGESIERLYCVLKIDPTVADAAIDAAANLVDESKIVAKAS